MHIVHMGTIVYFRGGGFMSVPLSNKKLIISTLGMVAKNFVFSRPLTPSKNEQNQKTKKPKNMPRTVSEVRGS